MLPKGIHRRVLSLATSRKLSQNFIAEAIYIWDMVDGAAKKRIAISFTLEVFENDFIFRNLLNVIRVYRNFAPSPRGIDHKLRYGITCCVSA